MSRLLLEERLRFLLVRRKFSAEASCEMGRGKKGLVLGAYDGCAPKTLKLSVEGEKFDGESTGKLKELLKGTELSLGKAAVFNNLGDYYGVAVTAMGLDSASYNELENINECKENIRVGTAIGSRVLQDMGCDIILVDGVTNSEAAAEGAALAVFKFEEYKNRMNQSPHSKVLLHEGEDKDGWNKGMVTAESQNIARKLTDMPANMMTPSQFAKSAIDILCPSGVTVEVRDRDWLESKRMTGFLGVAKGGSCEPPLLLEISYCGGSQDDKPIVMVGKGVTFDSGGFCLHSCKDMRDARGDMAGAAVVVGTLKGLSTLNLPINCDAMVPLSDNMPGGSAVKPGDVVIGLGGKTIRLEDTSKEARVILSDVLAYSSAFRPCLVINIGTVSKGVECCLGSCSTGCFSTSDVVWKELQIAGSETGDRVWRLPLWKMFWDKLTVGQADLTNLYNKGKGGEGCAAASFLLGFAPPVDFLHMDITGTAMPASGHTPYLRAGTMTGRPTRTVIQFLYRMACPSDVNPPC